jgi:hypothetical protein
MEQQSVYEFQPEPNPSSGADLSVLQGLTPEQWIALEKFVLERRTKTHPKLIDIRFVVDVIFSRFYVVLMVGKDRRDRTRNNPVTRLTRIGNTVAAILLLLGANLVISMVILLTLYLTKSVLGFDLMPGHISQQIEHWSK